MSGKYINMKYICRYTSVQNKHAVIDIKYSIYLMPFGVECTVEVSAVDSSWDSILFSKLVELKQNLHVIAGILMVKEN